MEHWSRGLFSSDIEQVIDGYDDPNLDYQFDVTDIVRVADGWYIVNTAGCSCPSYEEVAEIEFGPFTDPAVAIAEYSAEHAGNYYETQRKAVLAALAQI